MAEVKDYSGYTLHNLQEAVKDTWWEFAEWADIHMPEPFESGGNRKLGKFRHGFHKPINVGSYGIHYEECEDWIDLAWGVVSYEIRHTEYIFDHGLYEFVFGKDYWKSGPKESSHIAEAVNRKKMDSVLKTLIAWKQNGLRIDRKLHNCVKPWNGENLVGLRWCRWVLRRPFNHERFFWVSLRDKVRKELPKFCGIAEKIHQEEPLTERQHELLAGYMLAGQVVPTVIQDKGHGITVENHLEPSWYNIDAPEIERHMEALLAPVAYQLTIAWEGSQSWPKFVITCHNPACGKSFYSARKSAVTCPRRNSRNSRSECKKIWDAYRKWLQAVYSDKKPAEIWNNHDLKQEFLAQYRPRGPQSGVLSHALTREGTSRRSQNG